MHRNVWWHIKVVCQVGLQQDLAVVSGLDEIAVDNEDGHDIIWVITDPVANCVEFVEVRSSIQ